MIVKKTEYPNYDQEHSMTKDQDQKTKKKCFDSPTFLGKPIVIFLRSFGMIFK